MKVFIIAALTADGLIGRTADHLSTSWSSAEDRQHFVRLTKEAGVVVMGSRTFGTLGRGLPGRRLLVYTSRPSAITMDGVEPVNEEPAALLGRLKNEGTKAVAICGGASIYDLFMKADLVDELYITIEPILFGNGVHLFTAELNTRLSLLDTQQINNNTIVLHYQINRT